MAQIFQGRHGPFLDPELLFSKMFFFKYLSLDKTNLLLQVFGTIYIYIYIYTHMATAPSVAQILGYKLLMFPSFVAKMSQKVQWIHWPFLFLVLDQVFLPYHLEHKYVNCIECCRGKLEKWTRAKHLAYLTFSSVLATFRKHTFNISPVSWT